LQTQNTTVDVKGSGNADIAVNQSLQVRMVGSGKVRYKGNPMVEKSGSGSGTVEKVD
jgi:Putative auto-transporter adhesin, head GIN domain